ncbi:MAG TPA: hypothetical protein VF494_00250 [Candidatus Limnocylindrales bacterium]
MPWLGSWQGLLAIAVLSFLTFLERAYLDWRYVRVEAVPGDDITATLAVVAAYVALSAAWIWALVALAGQRRAGAIALLLLSGALLVAAGILTPLAFCPSPCQTAWPLMEVSNWAGLAVGLLAVLAAGRRLSAGDRSPSKSGEEWR